MCTMSANKPEEIASYEYDAAHTSQGSSIPIRNPAEHLIDASNTECSDKQMGSLDQPSGSKDAPGSNSQDSVDDVNQNLSIVSDTLHISPRSAESCASTVNADTYLGLKDYPGTVARDGTDSQSLAEASLSTNDYVLNDTCDESPMKRGSGVSDSHVTLESSGATLQSFSAIDNRTDHSLSAIIDRRVDASVRMMDSHTDHNLSVIDHHTNQSLPMINSHTGQCSDMTESMQQNNALLIETSNNSEPSCSANQQQYDSSHREQVQPFIGPIAPASHLAQKDLNSAQTVEEMDVDSQTDEKNLQQVQWENFDFSNQTVPSFVTWSAAEYIKNGAENFLRGCKWSPTGRQVLTNSNDNILRIFNMSAEITENEASSDIEQISDVVLRESSSVYDYSWYPGLIDMDRVATTCSGIPIHLWDAVAGKIVASYKAFDQYDEVTSAYSLSFNPSGCRLFGGYKKSIRIFDLEYPGRKCQLVKTCGPKKSWSQPSQPGIISCFAHCLTIDGFFAAGSYTRHIGMYDLRCEGLTCVMEGQHGGITHLMFSPDGNKLFTGARKDNEILCWDMRKLGTVFFSALRDVRTNQRMYFDITRSGRYMTSGNDDGTVTFWDLSQSTEEINGRTYLKPLAQFQAHGDSVNGVSFNPGGNLLASASGQRHFRNFDKCNSGINSNSSDSDSDNDEERSDFSLKVWRMPLAHNTAR